MILQFRRADQPDQAALLALMRGLYEHYGIALAESDAQSAVSEALADPSLAQLWLIEDGETTLGYLALTYGFSFEFGGRYGMLDELYLLPSARGQGYGTAALAFLEAEARRQGLKALFLEAETGNEEIQRFYRRRGFTGRPYDLLYRRL